MKRKGNTTRYKRKETKVHINEIVSKRKRAESKNKDIVLNKINDQRIADLVNVEVKFGFGKEWCILNGLVTTTTTTTKTTIIPASMTFYWENDIKCQSMVGGWY